MAKVEHYYTKLEPERFYHVYNRTVNDYPLFRNNGNCAFFLKKYNHYLTPAVETYAYCLLGNHFHLLIRIRSERDLETLLKSSKPDSRLDCHEIVSHQFRKFFQSYAMAFNKQEKRTGTLFQTPFKRALVVDNCYLTKLVYYIHYNPQHHGLTNDFREWQWSSYKKILTEKRSQLMKKEVLDWFGGKEEYTIRHHQIYEDLQENVQIE